MGSKKTVQIGTLGIGGSNPVRVESMLKTHLTDVGACLQEIEALAAEGCELIRVSFPRMELRESIAALAAKSKIPLMADIHFDPKLAVTALEAGFRSIRINPGNMGGSREGLRDVVRAAKSNKAVIRIGANGGSLNNRQLEETNGDRGAALVIAVQEQLWLLEGEGFNDTIISAKSSNVMETVRANGILAQKYPYPIHIGITEAGPGLSGVVKGTAGISLMLAQGFGDTIRVSLTAPGTEEVKTGYRILHAVGLRSRGVELISCPTCSRRRVDVMRLTELVREALPTDPNLNFSIAVMGCEVNGPREAAEADIGIAGTPDGFVLFKKGVPAATGRLEELPALLKTTIDALLKNTENRA